MVTDKGEYNFTVKAGPDVKSLQARNFKSFSDLPVDIIETIDADCSYLVCFDVTVPKNVECTWIYDGSSVMFDDPGYTALTHWDRMSDKTAYIVRDPDEKTNEKYREAYENLLKQSKGE